MTQQLYDKIIRSSRRKTMAISVSADNEVVVRVPAAAPEQAIEQFIAGNAEWIKAKKQHFAGRQRPKKQFVAGEEFYFKGQLYPLEFSDSQLTPLIFDQKFIVASRYASRCRELLERFYKLKAEELITERVKLYAQTFNLKYSKIRFNNAARQWGSCSHEGNLSFVWRLVMMPTRIIDYVVAHELAHLNELNHSPKFWREVERMRPDYSELRKFLKENGHNYTLD